MYNLILTLSLLTMVLSGLAFGLPNMYMYLVLAFYFGAKIIFVVAVAVYVTALVRMALRSHSS